MTATVLTPASATPEDLDAVQRARIPRWWTCETDDVRWRGPEGSTCWVCEKPGAKTTAPPNLNSQQGFDLSRRD